MAALRCRDGHTSDEPDYCSVCGLPMGAPSPAAPPPVGATAPAPVAHPAPAASACPVCSEPVTDPSARFCEVCRYDFQLRQPGPPPVAASATRAPATPSVVAAAPAPPGVARAPVSPAVRWELVLSVDPSL